jgi:hypothetical protein
MRHTAFINLSLRRYEVLLEFRKFQSFRSPDGGGFNAELYVDGFHAASLHDGGYGGGVEWRWFSPEAKVKWDAYVASLPERPWGRLGEGTYKPGPDQVAEDLINLMQERRQYAKWCNGCTVYRVEGMKKGAWTQVRVPFSPESKARVLEEHAGKAVVFANEQPMSPVLRVVDGLEPLLAMGPEAPAVVEMTAVKVTPLQAPKSRGIGVFCKHLIRQGKSTDEILAAVQAEFPGCNTSRASIASYRTAVNKEG